MNPKLNPKNKPSGWCTVFPIVRCTDSLAGECRVFEAVSGPKQAEYGYIESL